MDLTPAAVEITIDHLIIEGFGSIDQAVIRGSLERALARMVEERGLPRAWATGWALGEVRTSLDWDGRGGAQGLSTALAAHLYEGMTR